MAVEMIHTDLGETRVETGSGRVVKVDQTEGQRNAQVFIDATHLREKVTGWCDTAGPTWAEVQEAHRTGAEVPYRVETHRKRGFHDKECPIADVPNREKVRDLVGLGATAAVERPLGAPVSAPQPDSSRRPPETPTAPSGDAQRPYALALAVVTAAWRILCDHDPGKATDRSARYLAGVLLEVVDHTADSTGITHGQAWEAVQAALARNAVPFGTSEEQRAEWRHLLGCDAVMLARLAGDLR